MTIMEEKKELERLRKQMIEIKKNYKILEEKKKNLYKLLKGQEAGKLSIPDNQGGELSLVNTGMLSLKE